MKMFLCNQDYKKVPTLVSSSILALIFFALNLTVLTVARQWEIGIAGDALYSVGLALKAAPICYKH